MKIKNVRKLYMGLITPAMVAALLAGSRLETQAATGGHFTETFVVDESGKPLTDAEGRYYLIADDKGQLQSGSVSLRALFAAKLKESEEGAEDQAAPLVTAATVDRYYSDGRFYQDAALTEEITSLGQLLPHLLSGDESTHTIDFADNGTSLTVSATGDGFVGMFTGFDGVGRRVFAVSADGEISSQPKLYYDAEAGRIFADEAHSEPLTSLAGVSALGEGEEALYYLADGDRVIVVRRDGDGAAGFLADAYDPSFREPLFTIDREGALRYLGNITLTMEDGTGAQFFFNGDSILDGDLHVAGDVAALAPVHEGMIFSGFYTYDGEARIPLTNKEGIFDVDFDDPVFVAWRENVRQTLTSARVNVTGAAEYCYAFTFPAGEEEVSLYTDGGAWYAEEQLANEVASVAELVALPVEEGQHFAGFYLDSEEGEVRRFTDAEGNLLISAEEAIAVRGGRGGSAYARSYRMLVLTDGDDGFALYHDGGAFFTDAELLNGAEGVAIPATERESIYDEEVADDEEHEPIGEIVRTCIGFYLADEDGNLLWEDEVPKVPVVGEDGTIVFDFGGADVPDGDVVAKAVWIEETVLFEREGGAENEDSQVPEKTTTTKDGDKAKNGDDEDEDADGADNKTTGGGDDPDADAGDGTGASNDSGKGSSSDAGSGSAGTGSGSDAGSGSSAGTGGSTGSSADDGAGTGSSVDAGSDSGTGTESGTGAGDDSTSADGVSGLGSDNDTETGGSSDAGADSDTGASDGSDGSTGDGATGE